MSKKTGLDKVLKEELELVEVHYEDKGYVECQDTESIVKIYKGRYTTDEKLFTQYHFLETKGI